MAVFHFQFFFQVFVIQSGGFYKEMFNEPFVYHKHPDEKKEKKKKNIVLCEEDRKK